MEAPPSSDSSVKRCKRELRKDATCHFLGGALVFCQLGCHLLASSADSSSASALDPSVLWHRPISLPLQTHRPPHTDMHGVLQWAPGSFSLRCADTRCMLPPPDSVADHHKPIVISYTCIILCYNFTSGKTLTDTDTKALIFNFQNRRLNNWKKIITLWIIVLLCWWIYVPKTSFVLLWVILKIDVEYPWIFNNRLRKIKQIK